MLLLDKILELKNRFMGGGADHQDVVVIDGWYEEAKRLFLLQSLKGHDGVKYVFEIFQSEVEKINQQLLEADSKKLSDKERDRLLDRRNLAEKYLNLFRIESQLDELEKAVDNEGASG